MAGADTAIAAATAIVVDTVIEAAIVVDTQAAAIEAELLPVASVVAAHAAATVVHAQADPSAAADSMAAVVAAPTVVAADTGKTQVR